MTPDWAFSASKHGISYIDVAYVISKEEFKKVLPNFPDPYSEGGIVTLYIGFQHPQATKEIEVLVRTFPNSERRAKIFHVMPLRQQFREMRDQDKDS
jgi:hypothetical protein